jgi:pimeloyl-ACP methyl ester carboxylesterase
MKRYFAVVGDGRTERQIHYLRAGDGPVLLLLHALPSWCVSLSELCAALSSRYTVVAPDIAGFGLSDRLIDADATAQRCARDVLDFADRLGVASFALYAHDNSAPIAVEVVKQGAGRVGALILHDPFVWSAEETAALDSEDLPDFLPTQTGSHLMALWDHVENSFMFRPAHVRRLANRVDRDLPAPEVLNETVKQYFRAGEQWREGFLACARYPLADAVREIDVRTLVLAGQGVDETRLPAVHAEQLVIEEEASSIPDQAGQVRTFLERVPSLQHVIDPPGAVPSEKSAGWSRKLIQLAGGTLHVLCNLQGKRRPVMSLHDPGGSCNLVTSFTTPLMGERPVIAPDLPANGESDNLLADISDPTSGDYAQVLAGLIDALGVDEIDIIGRYSGGPVGMELSFQRPDLVKHLVQAAVVIFDREYVADVLEHYCPDISPRFDGTHLMLAWNDMKHQALWSPWYRRKRGNIVRGEPLLDPRLLHTRVVDLMHCGNMYAKAYAAMWTYPMGERLPQLSIPTLLCAPRWDPAWPRTAIAAELAPQCAATTLPDAFSDWHKVFVPFFEDR